MCVSVAILASVGSGVVKLSGGEDEMMLPIGVSLDTHIAATEWRLQTLSFVVNEILLRGVGARELPMQGAAVSATVKNGAITTKHGRVTWSLEQFSWR